MHVQNCIRFCYICSTQTFTFSNFLFQKRNVSCEVRTSTTTGRHVLMYRTAVCLQLVIWACVSGLECYKRTLRTWVRVEEITWKLIFYFLALINFMKWNGKKFYEKMSHFWNFSSDNGSKVCKSVIIFVNSKWDTALMMNGWAAPNVFFYIIVKSCLSLTKVSRFQKQLRRLWWLPHNKCETNFRINIVPSGKILCL